MSKKRGPFIGLDIGSHAVRAVELTVHGGQQTLQRFAAVELPAGAVADGEVVDAAAVGKALKQLWVEGKFTHRRVVVGVSSQRAIVRLADVPAMSDAELRTALKFEAEDLIPIPVEEAVLDFSTIDAELPRADASDPAKMRILLAAAQRDMVNGHLGALKEAGLKPLAVDPVALALLRAIPPTARADPDADGRQGKATEAVIAIGAGSTTVAIRENGIARFVRVLNLGGDDLVAASASEQSRAANPLASAPPTGLGVGTTTTIASVGGPLRALVDDIRGSLDFYLAQADTDRVGRIVVTGGAALSDGLIPRLQDALRQTVELADPLSTIAIGKIDLTPELLHQTAPYLVTPIGLALWGTVSGRRPISLLPDEVMQAKRRARQSAAVAVGLAAFAVVLGLAWAGRMVQVTNAQHTAHTAENRISALNTQIATTSNVTQVQAQLKAQQVLYGSALNKEVDWVRLMQQVTAVMPRDVHLTTLSVTKQAATAVVPGSGLLPADGTLTMGVVATGGPGAAASWLRALATIPGLQGTIVQTITQDKESVSFGSTSLVTSAAESRRSVTAGATK